MEISSAQVHVLPLDLKMSLQHGGGGGGGGGGTTPETNEIVTHICSCHNFFSLSSVQILFIPACCLLCVL